MNKVNIKPIIIFGSIVLVYFIVMLVIFGFDKDSLNNKDNNPTKDPIPTPPSINNEPEENEKIEAILFIEDGAVITKTISNWNSASDDLLLKKQFSIYDNSNLLGNYTAVFNNGWYIYDNTNNKINITEKILGVNTTKEFNRFSLDEELITEEDKTIVSKYLDNLGITYDINILSINKNTSDYNKDGIRESLYMVNLVNGLEEEYSYPEFSIAFINYIKQPNLIYKNTSDVSCAMSLTEYFELDLTKYLMFTCYYPSDIGYELSLYSLNGMYSSLELQDSFK